MKYLARLFALAGFTFLIAIGPVFAQNKKSAKTHGQLVPLTIHYPKPLFIDMTRHWDIPNLEPPTMQPPAPFYVPKGVRNLALNKPVTSNAPTPEMGELSMITDGDNAGSDGHYVRLEPGLQWVQIDLGARHRIYAIQVWHYFKQPRVYFDVIVQLSDDKNFESGVKTVFNNDNDDSSFLGSGKDKNYVETHWGKLIPVRGIKARYVRLYTNGNSNNPLNHYIEVQVYGK